MTTTPIAKDSADVFGYTEAFEEAIEKIGQISPQEFAQRYATPAKYLPQISFDPTTAKFWDDFNKNHLFQLNSEELAIFKRNGFVVSERLGGQNFADVFYRIYSHDLPVFVSADALLHAWHRSYDAILEELEETYLSSSLCEILEGMHEGISDTWKQYGNGVLCESIRDAEYFLAVALSLLGDKTVKTYLNQDTQVAKTLKAVEGEQLDEFELFGRDRQVDFSQFKVRGHYENSELLKRYFRAMMWCGRIDLRVAGSLEESSVRELGAAVVLYELLKQCGKFEQWQQFDQLLQTFVGRTDSMTFAQLGGILDQAKIKSPADVKDWGVLLELEADILAGKIGVQHIRSHYYESPFDSQKIKLPRSFTLMGQKFVVDSWVTSKVVYDDIEWNKEKIQRRIPTCLDVAFAALGNDQVVPELVARMTDFRGREFRDGLNYQHNLAAVRDVIDEQKKAVWEENIYMSWLATLRELSAPTTDPKYPEAMRTRASAMKTLNTQLASWTQLRHDTILYVKQSYSMMSCYYPAGFVEPRPAFWERFEKMVRLAADLIEKTPFPDRSVERSGGWGGHCRLTNLRQLQEVITEFFDNFAFQLATLKGIAAKQLAQQELSKEESRFLKKIVEAIPYGSGGQKRLDGWYLRLFYKGTEDCEKQDAIVADVHTNLPAQLLGDPGCVLHQGVGNVDLLMMAVDNGEDKRVYAGPVLSHYEFEMPGVSRKSDSEWRCDLEIGKVPPRPDWTRSYLLPKDHFSKFTNLTSLDLRGKQLTVLPKDICRLTQLTSLNLSNNQLTTLPKEIGNLTNLTELDLSGNQLRELPAEIGNLINLKMLNLSLSRDRKRYRSSNHLKALPREIGQLSSLMELDLSNNQLAEIPPEIGHLTNLTKLFLSRNQLKALPPEIGQLTNLIELKLWSNRLTELPAEIENLTNLTELNLSYNQLTELPAEIGNLTNLKELNVSYNKLTVLPLEIANLAQMSLLSFDGNQLTDRSNKIVSIIYALKDLRQYREISDRRGEASTLMRLGKIYLSLGQNQQQTIEFYQQALNVYQEIGDRRQESRSLTHLGLAYNSVKQHQQGIEILQQALTVYQELGDRSGEGGSLCNLGHAYGSLKEYQQALDCYQQALSILQAIGHRQFEANTLTGLGNTYYVLKQYQQAIEYYQQALTIRQKIGDEAGIASSLGNLGNTYYVLKQYQQALECYQQTLTMGREIGDKAGIVSSLGNLGNTYYVLKQYQQALECYQQALTMGREIGDKAGIASSLSNLGNTYYALKQYQQAIKYYQQALTIQQNLSNQAEVAASLNSLGKAYDSRGEYHKAIEYYQQALALQREIDDHTGEATS